MTEQNAKDFIRSQGLVLAQWVRDNSLAIAPAFDAALTAIEEVYAFEMTDLIRGALVSSTEQERRECLAKAQQLIDRRHELLCWLAAGRVPAATSTPQPPAA